MEQEAEVKRIANLKRGNTPQPQPDTQLIGERRSDGNRHDTETASVRARAVGTNRTYLSAAEKLLDEHPDKAEEIKAGKKTISQVMREVKREERKKANAPVKGQRGFQAVVTQIIESPQEDRNERRTDAARARAVGTLSTTHIRGCYFAETPRNTH